jgi:hypothetical protein
MNRPDVLTDNSKLDKSEALGLALIRGFHGLPGLAAGRGEACPDRGSCFKSCLAWSAYGQMPTVLSARRVRHRFLFGADGKPTADGLQALRHDLERLELDARYLSLPAGVRLNVMTDYPWERLAPRLFRDFPQVMFYDYTKSLTRWRRYLTAKAWPANYSLAFSASEDVRLADLLPLLRNRRGHRPARVSVVCAEDVRSQALGSTVRGVSLVDGDAHDAIWLQPAPALLLLSPKGPGGSRTVTGSAFVDAGTDDVGALLARARP